MPKGNNVIFLNDQCESQLAALLLRLGHRCHRLALHRRLPRFRPICARHAAAVDGRHTQAQLRADGFHQHRQFHRLSGFGFLQRHDHRAHRTAQFHFPFPAGGGTDHGHVEQVTGLCGTAGAVCAHRHGNRRGQCVDDESGVGMVRGKAAGFMSSGSGLAIIFAGFFIPFVNRASGAEGWRISWLALGAIVVVIAFLCLILLRNKPSDLGLAFPGDSDQGATASARAAAPRKFDIYRSRTIYHLGAIYFLFGFTYVIYATFIVTTLVKERGMSEALAGNFWSVVGFLSLFSGPVFGSISDKLGRKAGMVIVFSVQFLAYLLVASGLPGIFLYLSIFCYGLVAWSIPAIMAAAVGDYAGR